MILTLSGTDGVGKSSVGTRIMRYLEEKKIDYRTLYVRGAMTPLSSFYKRIFCKRKITGARVKFGLFISQLELIFNWCIRIKLLRRKNRVILCDRYIFDTLVDFRTKYGEYFKEGKLWRFLMRHAAVPDISFLYKASENEIISRLKAKNESAEIKDIRAALSEYEKLKGNFDFIIDAHKSEEAVAEETLKKAIPLIDFRRDSKHLSLVRRAAVKLSGKKGERVFIYPVLEGLSGAHNYSVSIGGKKLFFAKLYSKRSARSFKLMAKCNQDIIVFPRKLIRVGIMKNIALSDWIEGEAIEKTPEMANSLAQRIKELHALNINKAKPRGTKRELFEYLLYIKRKKVDFPHKNELIAYIKGNKHLAIKANSLLHFDMHIKNVILDKNEKIRLIDCENAGFGDPLREFVYAAIFHEPNETEFYSWFLHSYFDSGVTDEMYQRFIYYAHVHMLRMIVCNDMNNMPEESARIAESVYTKYHKR